MKDKLQAYQNHHKSFFHKFCIEIFFRVINLLYVYVEKGQFEKKKTVLKKCSKYFSILLLSNFLSIILLVLKLFISFFL